MTDTSISVLDDLPALSVARSPSSCRLCNIELWGLQTWRAHVKSDGHVCKLQSKYSNSGNSVPRPSFPTARDTQAVASMRCSMIYVNEMFVSKEQDVEADSNDRPPASEFITSRCIFCTQDSNTLDDNLTHMASAHGFNIPFQDCLAVDVEIVVRHLHSTIHDYQKCIGCGTRRNTAEGVQQHMLAKGHFRFDVTPDTEEFYQLPQLQNVIHEQMRIQRIADVPVRLPSGKLVSQRNNVEAHEPRLPRREASERRPDPTVTLQTQTPPNPSCEVVRRQEQSGSGQVARSSEALLAARLSRLRVADVRVQNRVEVRKRGRLEQANNSILKKHYRLDAGDSRIGRHFN